MLIEYSAETWEYDGSFYGFLTIVYHAFKSEVFPESILTPETSVESLFLSEWIEKDEQKAQRIYVRLQQRLKPENFQFILDGFYATVPNKESHLLEALLIALDTKDSLTNFIGHPSILAIHKGIKTLLGEAHLFTGFVRFEYVGKILFSKISPKYFSLPYICPHFAERYPLESIMIYDETHRLLALIKQGDISFVENADCPHFEEQQLEEDIQDQWKTFLRAVTIQERINKKVQLSHMPLRFQKHMPEWQ
ncbi:TIGR03915 family putative DNA repair protein [Enterococcus larvae]|uniref:TIGR03915 family putative DNA repair protein n=1 Tax=Enterococcus larvae TaxID=2794352 RepID=UPI001FD8571F|nr:TIGR03915 family putative DNA repair protein [Enterococcus larvae]